MGFVSEEQYYQTLEILRGNETIGANFLPLAQFIETQYDVKVYNILHDRFLRAPKDIYKYRIDVLLASKHDYLQMSKNGQLGFDEKKQKEIAEYYCKMINKNKFLSRIKVNEIFVCFHNFSQDMKEHVNNSAFMEAEPILTQQFQDAGLWRIIGLFSGVFIFFMTDDVLQRNKGNGICDQMEQAYAVFLEKHDEFACFREQNGIEPNISFDSKENVDANYAGNLHYYFK